MSEKHTVIREIAKGTGLLSGGEAVAKLFSLLGFILMLRFLAVTDYGTYRLVFAAYGALYIFSISGMNSFIQPDLAYELGKGNRGVAKGLFRDFSLFKLIIGAVLFLLTLFGAHIIGDLYSVRVALYLRIISPLFLVSTITEIAKTSLAVDQKFGSLNLHNVSGSVAKFLLIGLLVWFFKLGVLGAILASAFSILIPLLLILPAFFRSELLHITDDIPASHPLLSLVRRHGKWAIGDSYFNGLGRNIAPLVIKLAVGTEAVAVYGVADAIVSQAASLSALKTVLTPIVPREIDNTEHAPKILAKGAKYSILFNILEGAALVVVLPLLITHAFPQYTPYVGLLQLVLVTLIPLALSGLITSFFFALRMQRQQFFFTVTQTILEGGLLLSLGFLFGLPGLMVAYFLNVLIYQLARLILLFYRRPDLRFHIRDIFSYDTFDQFLLARLRAKILNR